MQRNGDAAHAGREEADLASPPHQDQNSEKSRVCNDNVSDCERMRALLHARSSMSPGYNTWRNSISTRMRRMHESMIIEVVPDVARQPNSTDECPNQLGEVRRLRSEMESLREENGKLIRKVRALSLFSPCNTQLSRLASNCSLGTANSTSMPSCTPMTNSSASGVSRATPHDQTSCS